MRSSIPFNWKQSLSKEFTVDSTVKYEISVHEERIDILNSAPKKWYAAMIQAKSQTIKREASWNQELSAMMNLPININWEDTYIIPYTTIRETKFHTFQYRIYHRLITCNRYLQKIRLRDNAQCSFCEKEDSISHFLLECTPVRTFWTDLAEWCETNANIPMAHLSATEILLGISTGTTNRTIKKIQNWIILVAKFYLHREKLFNQGQFSVIAFLREAKKKLHMENLACK